MAALRVVADPFAALGLQRDASPRAIKARYYQLARRYHPNTNHGAEAAQKALSAHFHRIHDAYVSLSKESQRRRLVEWLELAELETTVESARFDLEYLDNGDSESDGWSSDVDDFDLTHLTKIKRARSPAAVGGAEAPKADAARSTPPQRVPSTSTSTGESEPRGRGPRRKAGHPAFDRLQTREERESSDVQTAALRRKRLSRMKRKELEAFEAYRDAKLAEIHAQIKAERLKAFYERAKERREQVEKLPRETTTRVRLVQRINMAISLFKAQAPKRQHRPTLTTSGPSILTGDGEFTSVSSPISARNSLAVHRRGWSSDISGDQTDSEDDDTPHGSFRKPLRSPTPSRRARQSRDVSPVPQPGPAFAPAFPIVDHRQHQHKHQHPHQNQHQNQHQNHQHQHQNHQNDRHDANGDIDSEPGSKFRLLVKRPTGFDNINGMLGNDNWEDLTSPIMQANSHSSIPPPPLNLCRDLVRIDPEQMNYTEDDCGHSHSPPPNTRHSSDDSDSDLSRSPARALMFEIKSVGELRFPVLIPFDHIHILDIAEESRLLGKPPDTDAKPEDLLSQLYQWDPVVAGRFMVKEDIKARFAFRLICSNREFVRQHHRSFIALSYRRKRVVEKHGEAFTLPLSKEMLQAVWEERVSDDEGLWIDQCCIKQDDDTERTVSMSAMDLVYRGARLIVVVLDDVELKSHEAEVLENHIQEYTRMKHVAPNKRFRRHQPPWLEGHEDLFNVLSKLLAASWFRRAWCRHEMRLARDHVFLIPCHTVGSFRKTILRLTSACIAHFLAMATEVPFEREIELLKPALHAFFRDRTDTANSGTEVRSHHGNFTTVAAEVFGMEAGGDPKLPESQRQADARWDKMSIILNAMECGLTLQSSLRISRLSLSKEDCYYSLLMLALAARDPGALASVGKPLLLTPPPGQLRSMPSWMFEPTVVDAGLNNFRTLDRLPSNSHIQIGVSRGAHWINLDLKFLGAGSARGDAQAAADDEETFTLAREFVRKCEEQKWGRHRKRYLINDSKANENFGSMREVYIQTVACVFCCGPEWMTSICQRYGVGRWRQDLQSATWLLVSLRNMYGKWPQLPADGDWTSRAAGFIMDFVNFLVIRGMPQRQLKAPETWKPVWVTTANYGKVLIFTPEREGLRTVVPTALLDADYLHLARLWILEPRTTEDKWTLLGKSVLFSDDLAMQVINSQEDAVRLQQRVYGRTFG